MVEGTTQSQVYFGCNCSNIYVAAIVTGGCCHMFGWHQRFLSFYGRIGGGQKFALLAVITGDTLEGYEN